MHSIHTATNAVAIVYIFHFLATLCTVMRTIVCIFPKFFITYIIPTVTIKRTRCATIPHVTFAVQVAYTIHSTVISCFALFHVTNKITTYSKRYGLICGNFMKPIS